MTRECLNCGHEEPHCQCTGMPVYVSPQDRALKAGSSSLCSALVLLHARWLENAAIMESLAEEEPEDSQEQLECYERMRTLRDCASQLKAAWAGMKENDQTQRTAL